MVRIIGVDPGSDNHGMVVLDDGNIVAAYNRLDTDQFFDKVTNYVLHKPTIIVFEDLAAYSLRLTPQVIQTAKFIGMAVSRLKMAITAPVLEIPRSAVKKWVYEAFSDIAAPMCQAKADKNAFEACDVATRELKLVDGATGRKARTASFVYVDDKIVTECMKYRHEIEKPKPGDGYRFGLKEHSWQALAIATMYYDTYLTGSVSM